MDSVASALTAPAGGASMRAVWLSGRSLSLRTVTRPVPSSVEALVRVRLAGICSTDLQLVRGYYPYDGIPGHEFVGTIEAAPDALDRVGERVVGDINVPCGACPACLGGRRTHCPERTVLGIVGRHGAFASHLALPLDNLHRVPDDVPDEAAVFAEPLAAALEILEQVHVRPGWRAIVVGAGRLGHLVAQVLAMTGCDLVVVARYERQREWLAARGISTATEGEPGQGGADLVVEATGTPEGFHTARRLVRPRGTLVLKSTYHGSQTADFSSLVVDEVTLVGSRCGSVAAALRLLTRRHVDPRPLVAGRYLLTDAAAAFEHAARASAGKVLLAPCETLE